MAKVYGIDLGTTYSVITALEDDGTVKVIENFEDGGSLLASAVYFPEGQSEVVVGAAAKREKPNAPDRVVEFVKRFIGKEDAPSYEFDGIQYDPTTISALILKRLKTYAEEQGYDVRDVVITCPAYFGNPEKAATRQAGEIAGLNVLDIVHEPTAAALNYCAREFPENRKIMVYDLGGGTFDITLLDFSEEEGVTKIKVIKTIGNHERGGIDWDKKLFDLMCKKYSDENGIELSDMDEKLKAIIMGQVEGIKISLTRMEKKSCSISYNNDTTQFVVTRQEFEECTKGLVNETVDLVDELLRKTGFKENDVNVVLLVGGSTFMPMIQNAVKAKFPDSEVRFEDPNLAVAKGAAISAGLKLNEIIESIEEKIGSQLDVSDKQQNLSPVEKEVFEHLTEKSNSGKLSDYLITQINKISPPTDRLTRSLGPAILVPGDKLMIDNLLFVDDEIPAKCEKRYETPRANMSKIAVPVYENVSEIRDTTDENFYVTPTIDINDRKQETEETQRLKVSLLGTVYLPIPPNSPQGYPIDVLFVSDTSGLHVTVTDGETGEKADDVFISENLLTPEEVKAARERLAEINTRADV